MRSAHHVSRPSSTLFATMNPTLDRRPFTGAAIFMRASAQFDSAGDRNSDSGINKNGGAVSG